MSRIKHSMYVWKSLSFILCIAPYFTEKYTLYWIRLVFVSFPAILYLLNRSVRVKREDIKAQRDICIPYMSINLKIKMGAVLKSYKNILLLSRDGNSRCRTQRKCGKKRVFLILLNARVTQFQNVYLSARLVLSYTVVRFY